MGKYILVQEKNKYQRDINNRNKFKGENTSGIILSDFVKYIPFFGLFILLCAASNLYYYYSFFGINIFKFIESGDILILFFDYIVVMFLDILIFIIILTTMYIILRIVFRVKFDTDFIYMMANDKSDLFFWLINIVFFLVAFFMFFSKYIEDGASIESIIWYILYLGLNFYSLIIVLFLKAKIFNTNFYSLLILFSLFVLYHSFFQSKFDANNIVKNNNDRNLRINNTQVSFIYNNKRIASDSVYFYIGNTNKYLFLYSDLFKNNKIYPLDKLENLNISNKN